jgi:acyl carrier protein
VCKKKETKMLKKEIYEIIMDHSGLAPAILELDDNTDLYRAGMKSFASVQLMLALEDNFEIEFPESMLTRATFRSPAAIEQAVRSLKTSVAA